MVTQQIRSLRYHYITILIALKSGQCFDAYDIPAAVLKEMLSQGKITRPQYTKLRKGEALDG